MRQWTRWTAAVVALLVASAALAGRHPARDRPARRALNKSLREVINTGAALYNKSDHAGCYRIYQGGLTAVQGLLDHHPELQKAITTGLAAAERDPLVWHRAFTLRAVLDKVRKGLAARPVEKGKDTEKAPLKDDDMKKAEEKKDEKKGDKNKGPEKKSEVTTKEEKKGQEKQPEKKSEEKKEPEKKTGNNKPNEKKDADKKDIEKKDDSTKDAEKDDKPIKDEKKVEGKEKEGCL